MVINLKFCKRAQIALIDALVFLTLASVVSVSLTAAFCRPPSQEDDRLQDYVHRAHQVLLDCDLPSSSSGASPSYLPGASIASAMNSLFDRDGRQVREVPELVRRCACEVLDKLFPAPQGWTWVLHTPTAEVRLGQDIQEVEGVDVYSSSFVLSAEPAIESRLLVWRL